MTLLFPRGIEYGDSFYNRDLERKNLKKATEQWGHPLNQAVIEKILEHTECYPKYVNALCGKLWASGLDPSVELVDTLWEDFVFSRKDDVFIELKGLKMNERKLLRVMCNKPTSKPYSMEYASIVNLSLTSLRRALEDGLGKKEIVIQDTDSGIFYVVDPVIKAYLRMH